MFDAAAAATATPVREIHIDLHSSFHEIRQGRVYVVMPSAAGFHLCPIATPASCVTDPCWPGPFTTEEEARWRLEVAKSFGPAAHWAHF